MKVELEAAHKDLPLNVPATAEIVVETLPDALVVPYSCVRHLPNSQGTLRESSNGTVRERTVKLGAITAGKVQIIGDVAEGTRVVGCGRASADPTARWWAVMEYLREALSALGARRLQLFLATFGVGVGVASMVFLVAVVSGVHRMVQEQFRMRGAGLLEVSVQPPDLHADPAITAGASDGHGRRGAGLSGPALGRTAVRRAISGYNARFGPQETAINLQAVSETFFDLARTTLDSGRPLTRDDLASRRRVIVHRRRHCARALRRGRCARSGGSDWGLDVRRGRRGHLAEPVG